MRKSIALMGIIVFLTALCLITAKPALSYTDVAEDSWVSKAPMQQARAGLGVVAVNGKIYAIGGSTQSGFAPGVHGSVVYGNINIGSFVGTNEEYDPASDTWTFKKPMPTPRIAFAIAVYQNKIYCIGGRSIAGSTSDGYTGVNEVYDPTTDTWETKAPMPTARGWLTAGVVNDKIYLIGGYPTGTLNEVYDPITDLWTTKAPIPTSIATIMGWISTAVDGKIYVIGGYYGSGKLNQIYDPETDRWSQGTPPPSLSWIITAGVTTGFLAPKKIYVIGPQVYGEPSNGVYDPVNNSWTFGADVPTRRYNFDVAVVDDKIYAIGGHTYDVGSGYFEPTALNEMYTPLGYGTVPPVVAVVSPEHKTYNLTSVSLVFTVNKPALWMGYSLDGQDKITIAGNTTLSGLQNGIHNLTVYATDQYGNTGASETVYFSVEAPEPFPAVPIAAASGAAITAAAACIFYYRKKRSH